VFKVEPVQARAAGFAGSATAYPDNLPVGTVVTVEAVRDAMSGQLGLQMAGRRWRLKAGAVAGGIEAGQRLEVRVVRNQPDVELEIMRTPHDVAAALRRELPQQASPLRLLANLEWVSRSDADGRPALPPAAQEAATTLWRQVPTTAQLATPAGLERACLDSGARLENLLATGNPKELDAALETNWKALLYRLKDTLNRAGSRRQPATHDRSEAPVPTRHGLLTAISAEPASLARAEGLAAVLGELAQQVHESIARVTCNQLASLDGGDAAPFPMLVEVPFRDDKGTGLLRLRIGREPGPQESSSPLWYVEFALDLAGMGPLRGRVALADGRVSVTLRPELAALAQAIDARFDELQQTLAQAGVPVGKFVNIRSDPVDSSPTGSWLVNLRA
jgi:hypothetical protein